MKDQEFRDIIQAAVDEYREAQTQSMFDATEAESGEVLAERIENALKRGVDFRRVRAWKESQDA